MASVIEKAESAKEASRLLAAASTGAKNACLRLIAEELEDKQELLMAANSIDLERGRAGGMSAPLLDRLALSPSRVKDIAEGVRKIVELEDPVGEVLDSWSQKDGLRIDKVRVPFGVVGIIYEARPNVTVDAAALCLKTGNAVILRGSSTAQHSNSALVGVIQGALARAALPAACVQLIEDTSHEAVEKMLQLNRLIDVVIPRGGAGLINFVMEKSRIPVIETGTGNCHVYIHEDADAGMAESIVINAKTQRPSVCNAAETLLVHRRWAGNHLAELIKQLQAKGVECRGCPGVQALADGVAPAGEKDWETEFLDMIMAVKIVDSLEEAVAHVNKYGTKHSEAIVTESREAAARFMRQVDAAAVYHNASTRFTDGFVYGFGAEIGISTQKLHARGPMGLPELTSYKYQVYGAGQVREK